MRHKIRQGGSAQPSVEPGNGNGGPRRLSAATRRQRHRVALGAGDAPEQQAAPAASGAAITGATDPRWVFAMQVADQLQGIALPFDLRQKLVGTAKVLGLTAFDANLIIAIVQDRARRGVPALQCPAAAEAQLAMVGLPGERRSSHRRTTWMIAAAVGLVLVLEVLTFLLVIKS